MLQESIRKELSSGEGKGLFSERSPQAPLDYLPAGTTLVSADNHFALHEDIFYDKFPAELKEKAPRIWWDEEAKIFQIGFGGEGLIPSYSYELVRSMEDRPGSRDFQERMKDLEAEGVAQEIVFPQILSMFFAYPDQEVRKWVFQIYNEHMAELQSQEPERFFPIAMVNYWEAEKTADSVREIAALGMKSFMLPIFPGMDSKGTSIVYSNPQYDAMWAAAVELDMPVCFHVGEGFKHEGLNGQGANLLYQTGSSQFRRIFGHLVFGLVFDRFPDLKVVFAESGINWAAGAIQDAEMFSNHHGLLFESLPEHRPSYYWHKNCYTTFQDDPVGMRLLDIVGADRVMWAVDYPHNEGIFGYTNDVVAGIVNDCSENDARLILGKTCQNVFKI